MDWLVLVLFIIVFIVLIVAISVTIVNQGQNSVLFFPNKSKTWSPQSTVTSIIDSTDYNTQLEPTQLSFTEYNYHGNNIWHFAHDPSNCKDRKVIFFCHGNSGNISQRQYVVEMCCWFDVDVILFDYKGFGTSNGVPTTYNICTDAQEIYYWAKSKYDESKIIIWGESIGGAPSCYLARKNNPGKLILFSTFSGLDDVVSMSSVISSAWKIIVKIFKFFVNVLPNRSWIKEVTCPILIIHSPDDKLIDVQQARYNYEQISHANKKFILITGDHSNPNMTIDVYKDMYSFVHDGKEMDEEQAFVCRKLVKKLIKQLMVW